MRSVLGGMGMTFSINGEVYPNVTPLQAKQTVQLRVRLEEHPWTWMFHCHVSAHAERGMMGGSLWLRDSARVTRATCKLLPEPRAGLLALRRDLLGFAQ